MTSLLPLLFAVFLQMSPAPMAPMATLARDLMSGIDEPRQSVARSAAEWTKLWREHAGDKPVPKVNFATRTVLAVFLGTRTSAGYAVEIVGTRAEGTGLVVLWSERQPERDMVSAQILTSPSHIVTVPRVAGAIRFEKASQ